MLAACTPYSAVWYYLRVSNVVALKRCLSTTRIGTRKPRSRLEPASNWRNSAQMNARLTALLNASKLNCIVATNPDGVITLFNTGAERMLGYTAERDGWQTDSGDFSPGIGD